MSPPTSRGAESKMLKMSGKRRWCSWRSCLLCIILSAVLLHVLGMTTSQDPGGGGSIFHRSTSFFYSGFSERRFHKIVTSAAAKQFTSIVVMSSNPRTGSSYTGELLSASSDSAYFFEPLWYYVDTKNSKAPSFEDKQSLLINLLKCNFHDPRVKKMIFSNRQSTFVFRKPSITGLKYEKSKIGRMGFLKRMETRCKKTRTRVIKTIRMNMTEMLSLLSSLPEEGRVSRKNFHVIYLVRDPRGIINSVKALEEQWPDRLLDPTHICSRMFNDTQILNNRSEQNLAVLKYEDIVREPLKQLELVSEKFNISLLSQVETFLRDHSSARWKENKSSKPGDSKSVNETKREENPLKEIMKDIAKQKEFAKDTDLEEDVTLSNNNSEDKVDDLDLEEEGSAADDSGTDYYDSKGKIMTVRRRRRRSFGADLPSFMRRHSPDIIKRVRGIESDPEGRSYYYSTYRRNTFDPDHWKTSLPRDLLEKMLGDQTCRKVLDYFEYKI